MIFDVHTHIFPDPVIRHREDFFADEPAFRWLYESPRSRLISAAELVAAMAEEGVERSVCFGFPWRQERLWRLQNDTVLEAMHRYPQQLIGFCCVNPLESGAPREVERCLAAGCRGVGELAFYIEAPGSEIVSALAPIADLCQGYQVPLMLHTNEPIGHPYPGKSPIGLEEIYRVVLAFPDLNLILAHWGGGLLFFALLKKEVPEALKNVYFDTAASPYLYRPPIYRLAAEIVGPEKILFGSDYPLLPPSRYLAEMQEAGVTAEMQKMITRQNMARLLRL
ncbi:MAG: amidohydrolase family protein [Desulfobacteraceae bacterium]